MMIDLLEVEEDKIEKIKDFPNAIYALHHSIDRKDQFDATASVAAFRKRFPEIKRLDNLRVALIYSRQSL